MATVNSIVGVSAQVAHPPLFEAVSSLESALIEAQTLGEALDLAAVGGQSAAWVYVYQRQIDALRAEFSKVQEAAFACGWGASA